MLFSSISFIYYFLPLVLAAYFLLPAAGRFIYGLFALRTGGKLRPSELSSHGLRRNHCNEDKSGSCEGRAPAFPAKISGAVVSFRNWVLLLASIVFYMWGEPVYVLVMLGQALSGWVFGLLIDGWRGRKYLPRIALAGAVIVGIGGLMFFKYTDFFIANINALTGSSVGALKLALPIGISFYTFQILSYAVDLYRGNARLQRNPVSFVCYVTLFPQLIAGPIVRYVHVEDALKSRAHSVSHFAAGARRFTMGLGKKVLVANVLGELVDIYKHSDEASMLFTWLYVVAYAFHIYFDFSGYSDMAIGLGRMFGFRFRNNFDYPYTADSVTDFWRRWHISLSSWFRDYVYIPLGGNRVRPARHIFNIAVTWLLTGFWHGAGWNFIIWGMYFALLLLLEKYLLGGLMDRLPGAVTRIYTILCFLIGWVFFDAASVPEAAARIAVLFGGGEDTVLWGGESLYYLRSYLLPLIIAAVGSTSLPARAVEKISKSRRGGRIMTILEPLFIAALLIVVTAYLVDGSFNPFIYFRF
jgi:alginate O-acetyltransferase complex protein AlgI